ncbi:MAG: Glycosyltransferase [Candidatus Alkanophagales archaeon MCA70_species_2]|nr:Glycosyltransferase [Candidatus Alkanophaga liquidiphilum]RLG38338.1 MAG: hypothetical protein DRN91_02970 [Candidatus Alkanophagales archaeon]
MNVAVGVAAYNEEANIGRLLGRLLDEGVDEIIVVTSGCTDRTDEIVAEFCKKSRKIKHIREPERRGKSAAVNIILREARDKDALVMLSADNLPERGGIRKLLTHLGEGVGAVSGRPVPTNDRRTLCGFASHLLWELHFRISRKDAKLTGEFYVVRPSLVGELPEGLINDDLFVEQEVRQRGYEIVQSDVSSLMRGPESVREFLRQRIRVHIGHLQLREISGYVPSTVSVKAILIEAFEMVEMKELPKLLVAFLLESLARASALLLFKLGKVPYKWAPVSSTKNLG